ncbi:7-keto-8-aminopelargonate synthetase [Algoriphagus hitonicola]|uniref:7-keto-8-aminopelargonate synthetase n=2 Tax=Algoriphagus hitonicola TaxID=435880 RepID=A0A1I2QPD7_9BACT|nr:7-keto-8-aminopelargonate synthetase [Algoriphagus hitonicola]
MIEIAGKEYLYFSGTSYLGIAQDVDFLDVLANNVFEWGANFGQSRNNNIRLEIFDEFEEFFAFNAGAPSAAVLSSGYLAGIAAWKSLIQNKDQIWIAPDAHTAIIPDGYSAGKQLDFVQWKKDCQQRAEKLSPQKILLIGNAVDPLNIHIHDYHWVKDIAQKHDVRLLIDDSHAFGVLGKEIFGTYSQSEDGRINLVVTGSLGKALGLPAGIILSNEEQILKIKSTPLFGGASPGSPAHLQTFLEMQHRYEEMQHLLEKNCLLFEEGIRNLAQITGRSDYPVFRFQPDEWVEQLESSGIICSSFPYPTAQSPRINRLILSAYHEKSDIEYLIDILQDLAKQS